MLVLDVALGERDVLVRHVEGGVAKHLFEGELVAARSQKLNREGVWRAANGLKSSGMAEALDELERINRLFPDFSLILLPYSNVMGKSKRSIQEANYHGKKISISQALNILKANYDGEQFSCLECKLHLDAHHQGTGQTGNVIQAHFEHQKYVEGQRKCSLRDPRTKGYLKMTPP